MSDDQMLCDLCGRNGPISWTYSTEASPEYIPEDPDWAVCDRCHHFIQQGNVEAIVASAVYKLPAIVSLDERLRKPVSDFARQETRRRVFEFWNHKLPNPHPEPGYRLQK